MLLIDNTSKLSDLIEFKEGCYYKFVALIRAKDYKESGTKILNCMEKQEILVKDWLIDNQEQLDKTLPDMLKVTELFKCRLYMCTDRKSIVKTLLQMRNNVNNYLDPFIGNPNASCSVRAIRKIGSSASNVAESSDKDGKRWMFDVDTKDPYVVDFITKMCGDNWIATLPTKNGFHVIAKKKFPILHNNFYDNDNEFEYLCSIFPNTSRDVISKYINCVDIKDNAMCLIAMEMDEMSCKLNITGVNINSEENND